MHVSLRIRYRDNTFFSKEHLLILLNWLPPFLEKSRKKKKAEDEIEEKQCWERSERGRTKYIRTGREREGEGDKRETLGGREFKKR